MIKLEIGKLFKLCGKNQKWQRYDTQTLDFEDVEQARDYIKMTYPRMFKTKIYRDDTNGNSRHCGYSIRFKTVTADNKTPCFEDHWITFYEITEVDLFDYPIIHKAIKSSKPLGLIP